MVVNLRAEKKSELLVCVIGFSVCLGFTTYTILNMMKVWNIQQETAENLGIPFIYDPYSFVYIMLSLVPTMFFLRAIIKTWGTTKRT